MAEIDDSILDTTKKLLGIAPDYTAFDTDIVVHINTAFTTLQQLGIGPVAGFFIIDNTATWDSFIDGDLGVNSVKTYMYLKVRQAFDPPTTSYMIEAVRKQAEELEWRMNVQMEGVRNPWRGPKKDPHLLF